MRVKLAALSLSGCAALLVGQIAVRNQGYVPFSDAPIYYRTAPLHDPVAQLQKRLERGDVQFKFEEPHGYLRSVLKYLDIPENSQMLVFSKTSFQFRRITPRTPRALYFNDDVYVGWVSEGKLEIISFDPVQGAIFYIIENGPEDKPAFQRAELDCTQCHVAAVTRGVPGVFLRSVHTNPTGVQSSRGPSYSTGHESPLSERFGGWYVTGTHGKIRHMGNITVPKGEGAAVLDREAGANVASLGDRIDASHYLNTHSDIVAQLVHAHQTQMHNLITQVNYRTRLALFAESQRTKSEVTAETALPPEVRKQFEKPAEDLLEYLLFANEAPLEDRVEGSTSYAREFATRGLRDQKGRSLRDFDLTGRIFRYPCSYLIYSDAFDSIPEPAKGYVYRRLHEVLTGKDQNPRFSRLSAADRRNVLEILLATKKGLPEYWHTTASARRRTTSSTPTDLLAQSAN